ncbi:MAG: purine-nucleoside phosphorylase [Candidatus Krumholzibacteriia bacterium]
MTDLHDRIQEAAAFIRARCDIEPEHGLILGTGLGGLGRKIEAQATIPFTEIPHFAASTATSHDGNLILGELSGVPVMAMQGRVHYYEGYSMQQITLPVRVMRALGARSLILSNAVGGMNPQFTPGDIVVTVDHINLMGDNPLIGPNDDRLGPRFPDMSQPYDRAYVTLAESVALELRIPLKRAVYVAVAGPNLETAAEYRFLRAVGADTVGMSSVPENLVAVHAGMRVLMLSVVTDACFPDALEPADVQKIIAVANEAQPRLESLVTGFLAGLAGA